MAIGDKIELAFKSELQAVEQSVATLNTQINTATTGIESRVNTLEGNNTELLQLRVDVDSVDDQLNNVTTGLVGAVTSIDNQLNEAGTGVVARLEDLEQGGTSTTKFRTHSPNGVYEDGEVVQRDDIIYKSNNAIDGSSTPVPFVVGVGVNMWTPFTAVISNPLQLAASDSNGKLVPLGVTVTEGQIIASGTTVGTEDLADDDGFIHHDTSIATGNKMRKTKISKIWDYISSKLSGAVSSYLTSNATVNRVIVSNASGKLAVSGVTTTELNMLDGGTSNIQNQLNAKPTIKCKILKGVFPGTADNFTKAHGIPDGSTVLGFCMGVQYSGAADVTSRLAMPPNFTDSANFHYQVYIADGDLTVRQISSSSLRGMPYKCVIWYD